jgi:hypothetical protein
MILVDVISVLFSDELHEKDRLIQATCDEKIKVILDIFDAASRDQKPVSFWQQKT